VSNIPGRAGPKPDNLQVAGSAGGLFGGGGMAAADVNAQKLKVIYCLLRFNRNIEINLETKLIRRGMLKRSKGLRQLKTRSIERCITRLEADKMIIEVRNKRRLTTLLLFRISKEKLERLGEMMHEC